MFSLYLHIKIIKMQFENLKIKDVQVEIAAWTKSLRKNQNLSQEELAQSLNVSRITIQNLESCKNVTLETLLKVLFYFDKLQDFNDFIISETNNNSVKSLY